MVDRLEKDFESQLAVIRVDAGQSATRGVLSSLRIRGHPTLVLLDADGEEVARFLGPPTEAEVSQAVCALLGESP